MRELLVLADNDKQLAFYHALELAKNTKARIEFVNFVHAAGIDSSEILTHDEKKALHNNYLDKEQDRLESFLSQVDLGDVKVNLDVVWEKAPDRWVISRCDQKSFDFVFKSGKRNARFEYTSADWQLIQHCPEPLMMVSDTDWHTGGVILAALDLGSSSSKTLALNEDILSRSFKLAEATNSQVHACYSIAIPKGLEELDLVDPVAYEKKVMNLIDPIIRKMIENGGLNRKNIHLVSGKPDKEILRISKEINADVVVMGNKTRTSLRGRLLGITAESILNKIEADVVIIK
jgi:universal stress protein E